MKKRLHRILALLLACCLLLSGCSASIERLTENLRAYKAGYGSYNTARPQPVGMGLDVPLKERFPNGFKSKFPLKGDGVWEGKVKPLFDPMGGQSAYEVFRQMEYTGSFDLTYMDMDYLPISRRLAGDCWRVSFPIASFDDMRHLEQYAMDLGCEILSSTGGELAFRLRGEDYWWWGKLAVTSAQHEEVELQLLREMRLETGKTLKVTPGMGDGEQLYFSTQSPDGKLQSMRVDMVKRTDENAHRGIDLQASSYLKLGDYQKEYSQRFDLRYETVPGGVYHLDHISQDPGDLTWTIKTGDYHLPPGHSVSLTMETLMDIPTVKYGEELGALLVKGAPWGSVKVPLNEGNYRIIHTDLQNNAALASQTGDGDTLIWLPSGYWDIEIAGQWNRLVPISAGELTVLTAPTNLRRAQDEDAANEAEETAIEEMGLSFLSAPREVGSNVEVDILLFDSSSEKPQPTKDDVQIAENGLPAEVLKVEPLNLPPNVVLLLDSSGSMKGQLEATLETAKEFVKGLPDDTSIQVVDFSSTVNVFKGNTKAEALKNIDTIQLGGYTALYEVTITGLDLLKGLERPTMVLFTDGVNEPLAGGLTDKSKVIDAIAAAGVPIYTIGFGPEHAPPPAPKPDPNADPNAPPPEVEIPPSDIRDFALLSEGKYYSAADQDALKKVFDAIAARIGSAFTVTYKRPKESSLPDTPVVMLVIDDSGSMGTQMIDGTRLETLKAMYRQFLIDAPENTIMQAMDFGFVDFQMLTTDMASMLYGLSALHEGGGTEIVQTAATGRQALMKVATSKRILIYVTDEAMIDPLRNDDEALTFKAVLEKIKEQRIHSLWVGMSEDPESLEGRFKNVAEVSGGSYVVSADSKTLNDALLKMLAAMNAPAESDMSQIALQVLLGDAGAKRGFTGSVEAKLKPLPPKPFTGTPPEALKLVTGQSLEEFFAQEQPAEKKKAQEEEKPKAVPSPLKNENTAAMLTGNAPSEDTRVTGRTPLKASGKSEGLEIRATDLYRISRLRGVDPPPGMTFLAVNLELTNLFKDRPFQIPTIKSHFYLTMNDTDSTPASMCTWLAETPLTIPGDYSIEISKSETKAGMLLFLVDEAEPKSLQLSFYDTAYGHIMLPLMGSPKGANISIEQLPTTAPAKLSEAFTITITGCSDVTRIGSRPAPAGMVYRVVEGQIASNVQALLDLNPGERLFMDIATGSGAFRLPISPITDTVPMGYLSPKMLAPGSNNTFRWVFEVPEPLKDAKAAIYGDVYGGAIHIPIKDGSTYPAGQGLGTYAGEWIDLTINELGLMSEKAYSDLIYSFRTTAEKKAEEEAKRAEEEQQEEQAPAAETVDTGRRFYVVADITIADKKDGYGTSNINSSIGFVSGDVPLGKTAYDPRENPYMGLGSFTNLSLLTGPDGLTDQLALGVDSAFVVHDGESRRGLMVFALEGRDFYLSSHFFPDLRLPIPTSSFTGTALMRPKARPEETDHTFAAALDEEIRRVVEAWRAAHPREAAASQSMIPPEFALTSAPGTTEVPPPSPALYGREKLSESRSLEEVLAQLKGLAWRPSYLANQDRWTTRYAPEAVMTQGWGTEFDLAITAEQLLARTGVSPQRAWVVLTDEGRQALRDYMKLTPPENEGAKLEFSELNHLPALFYRDGEGAGQVLVVPFMKELKTLEGYAYLDNAKGNVPSTEYLSAAFKVVVEAIPISNRAKNSGGAMLEMGGLFGSLGGSLAAEESMEEETTKEITVLEESFSLTDLSMSAVDVGFALADDRAWMAWIDTPLGRKPGITAIEKEDYKPVRITYTVTARGETYIHDVNLAEGETPDGVFCTLGVNLPELYGDGLDSLDKTVRDFPKGESPDDISSLRWYNRNNLYRFIAGQTAVEDGMARDLGLVIGRSTRTRCIAVTAQKHGAQGKLATDIDLMGAFNQIHNGTEEARHAFGIGSGLAISRLEGQALGKDAVDFDSIWGKRPNGTKFCLVTGDTLRENIPLLREAGYPETLVRRMEKGYAEKYHEVLYLITDKPTKINGRERWAMLEIDGKTFETIAVLDTGGNGGFAEYLLMDLSGLDRGIYLGYTAGAMVGVSTGVWAFSAASLIEGDYNKMVALAKVYAGIANDAVQEFFNASDGAGFAIGYTSGGGIISLILNQEAGGPASGFEAGLNYYISQVK